VPEATTAPDGLWPVFALLLGLILGSFGNVCIHRLPLGESVVFPPSRCPRCRERIRPGDNVPVLSWLVLRGRCRSCRAPISWRYPAVELANGLLYLAVAVRYGPSLEALVWMMFLTALLVLSLVDLDHQILPDAITLPGTAAGLLASGLLGGAGVLLRHGLAAAAGYLVFAAIAKAYEGGRGIEGLGQGDWKLAAMLGAFLGWQGLLLVVLAASVAGTMVGLVLMAAAGRTAQHRLPFGTFLGLAGIGAVFFAEPVLRWYAGLFA
jgi:leader peptidase (prepilin peptidase)/N-methyltransferase